MDALEAHPFLTLLTETQVRRGRVGSEGTARVMEWNEARREKNTSKESFVGKN